MFIITCFGYETDKKDHRKLRWPMGANHIQVTNFVLFLFKLYIKTYKISIFK